MDYSRVHLAFPHQYEVDLEAELPPCPGKERVLYFPQEPYRGGRGGGLLARIIPHEGQPWIGMFAGEGEGLDKVLSTPDQHRVCVVSEGEGYLVTANDPKRWESVRCWPILDARPIPEQGLIVFADYTQLTAYSREGLAWTTRRLAWDGLRIAEVSLEHIRGFAEDPFENRDVEFVVETKTGAAHGGSYPLELQEQGRPRSLLARLIALIRGR